LKIYSSTEAAAELGIDARMLRRYLRADDSYTNAGQGGRYNFTDQDLARLRHAMKPKGVVQVRQSLKEADDHYLDDDPGVPLRRYTAALQSPQALAQLRAERRWARARRQQRLVHAIDTRLPRRYDDELVAW
jgi:DNA-binding transcriptional MerR regulator